MVTVPVIPLAPCPETLRPFRPTLKLGDGRILAATAFKFVISWLDIIVIP